MKKSEFINSYPFGFPKKWALQLLLIISLLFVHVSDAQSPDQDIEKDSKMIYDALDRYVKGWMSQDAALASQDYSGSMHCVTRDGKTIYTKTKLAEYFDEKFGMDANSNIPFPSLSHQITYLSNKIGVVHSMENIKGQISYHLRVFAKEGDSWKIINHLISNRCPKE